MSLIANMNNGVTRTSVNISEIRTNPLNRVSIDDEKVKSIAWSIQQVGQLENATIYIDDLGDGKKYTLIGGEQRYRAISYLVEKGAHDGMMFVNIIPKPITSRTEKQLIRDDNNQRDKTIEDKYMDILDAEEEYDFLSSQNKQPSGKKRDFVGKIIGMSGRNVDNIKKLFEGVSEDGKPIPVEKETDISTEKDQPDKDHLKSLAAELEKHYQCRIKLTKKSIQFTCSNTEELNELFSQLGIQDFIDGNLA